MQLRATGSSTATLVGASLSYPALSTMFFVPRTSMGVLSLAITIKQGGAQAITATPSMAMGTPGIPGTVISMAASHPTMGVNESMFMVLPFTLFAVPISIGKTGVFTQTFSITGALQGITVDFYAWTPHTLIFMGLTTKGVALPDVSAMGSFNLSAMGGGTVTLVSPSKVSINGAFDQRRTASFTTLKLSFVPEPGTVLLLAAGGLALAVLAKRSRR